MGVWILLHIANSAAQEGCPEFQPGLQTVAKALPSMGTPDSRSLLWIRSTHESLAGGPARTMFHRARGSSKKVKPHRYETWTRFSSARFQQTIRPSSGEGSWEISHMVQGKEKRELIFICLVSIVSPAKHEL